jgi:hypothetical protein
MRCYFIRDNQIEAVELLKAAPDDQVIREAAFLAYRLKSLRWQRYEIWEGRRLVYRYPPGTSSMTPPPRAGVA